MKHPESASTRTVVVVGNGMVCQRFCERLLQYSDTFRLVVFGEEPRPAYDRVKLTSYYEKARRGYPWHKAPPVLDRSRR